MIDWRYEIGKRRDLFFLWMARRLPRRIAYWNYIVQGGRYIKPDEEVPAVTYVELGRRMGNDRNPH